MKIHTGKRIGGHRLPPLIVEIGRWRIRVSVGRYRSGWRRSQESPGAGSFAARNLFVTYIRRNKRPEPQS